MSNAIASILDHFLNLNLYICLDLGTAWICRKSGGDGDVSLHITHDREKTTLVRIGARQRENDIT